MIRIGVLALGLALLAGCVTETSGGPTKAPKSVQLQAHLDLARGYLEQREWNRARDPLKRAVEIEPRSAEAYSLLGVMYQGLNEMELAEENYKRALRYDPGHALTLNNYGSFLYAQRRYADALGPLRTLVQDSAYRGRAQAYENLGLTELKVGNQDRARVAFERALSFNTVLPRSCLELASMAFDSGDYTQAARYYDMFRGRARQTASSLCLGLRLARVSGDQNQQASFEIALKNLYPNSAAAKRCIVEG